MLLQVFSYIIQNAQHGDHFQNVSSADLNITAILLHVYHCHHQIDAVLVGPISTL